MKQTYIIKEIKADGSVLVYSEVQKESTSFILVKNSKNFTVKEGSKITIGLPQKKEAINGVIALFTPILFAVLALVFSKQVAFLLKTECSENFKAVFISVCFLISCFAVIFTFHSSNTQKEIEIKKVLQL